MATKKKAARPAKKAAKKAPAKKPAKRSPAKKKSSAPALTSKDRLRLTKPRKKYATLIEQVLATWKDNPELRVPGLTRARLGALLARAEKASAKEQALARQMEARLRPLIDARLIAESELWRALLDTNAQIKVSTRADAGLGDAFSFLTEALTTRRSDDDDDSDDEEVPVRR